MKNIKKLLTLALALLLSLAALAACDQVESETGSKTGSETSTEEETAVPDFDYQNAEISEYITLAPAEWADITVTLSSEFKFDESAVDEYINDECFNNKEKTNEDTKVTDQAIKLGDTAYIYYTGYLDGVAFEGGSNAEDEDPYGLSIGSGSFIPGFEEGLIDLVPNTTSKDAPFDLNVTFPEDYGKEELNGKDVVFKVWVEYIIQYTIPEFNDDYVKNTLEYDGTAEEYKADIRAALEEQYDEDAKTEAMSAAISMLIEAADIKEYPEQSVAYWYAMYVDEFEYYYEYYQYYEMYGYSTGYDFDSLDAFIASFLNLGENEDWKEITRKYSKEMAAHSLVYYSIIDQEGLRATDKEINDYATELAEQYSYTVDNLIAEMGESKIKEGVLFRKVEELLLKNITITYEAE